MNAGEVERSILGILKERREVLATTGKRPCLGPYALGAVHRVEALAALELLPDNSVDMLLADPPYSSGGFTRGDRMRSPVDKYVQHECRRGRLSFSGDNRDARSWAYWSALWLTECHRVLKPGGYALTFSDWRQLPSATDALQAGGFVWRGIVAWDKTEAARAPHTGYFRHQCEYVIWGTKGGLPRAKHGGPWRGALRFPIVRRDKWHITGKPVELLRELVKVVPRGSIVLDPFAGSGTTLVACELEGRRGLGFELEPENVKISAERLARARGQAKAAENLARALGRVKGNR